MVVQLKLQFLELEYKPIKETSVNLELKEEFEELRKLGVSESEIEYLKYIKSKRNWYFKLLQ